MLMPLFALSTLHVSHNNPLNSKLSHDELKKKLHNKLFSVRENKKMPMTTPFIAIKLNQTNGRSITTLDVQLPNKANGLAIFSSWLEVLLEKEMKANNGIELHSIFEGPDKSKVM